MKAVYWVGSSLKDLSLMPNEVKQEIGYALYVAQQGEKHPKAKPLRGIGPGVYEIVSDHNTNTFRGVYVVNIRDAIYVLHCFKKKSNKGIKTPQNDIALIKQRLKEVKDSL